jgi:hypothetical protein
MAGSKPFPPSRSQHNKDTVRMNWPARRESTVGAVPVASCGSFQCPSVHGVRKVIRARGKTTTSRALSKCQPPQCTRCTGRPEASPSQAAALSKAQRSLIQPPQAVHGVGPEADHHQPRSFQVSALFDSAAPGCTRCTGTITFPSVSAL